MLPVSQIIAPTSKINPSERNYPKSLSILINTRIRGYPKLKYEPSMSVPGARSETVYFDPLIKLNNSVAGTVPKGYPPSERFTQFFDKGSFDSLISRTLSSSFFGQGKKTIEEATEADYIDNNIRVTLNQLFEAGNRFYIKGQPFTINGYDWNYGDWQVGTKNIERQFEMSGSSYGQGINNMLQLQFSSQEEALADQELENFKAMHPESVMRGKINPNMSKFEDSELLSGVAAGLKQTSTEAKKSESTSVTENQKIQAMLPSPFVELYGRDYIREDAINLDINTPIMQSDPISLSIIYYLDRNYNEDTRKNPKLKQLYDVFLKAAKEYKGAKENFTNLFGTENKSPENLKTNKQELSELRNELLKNKERMIVLLEPYSTQNSRYNKYEELFYRIERRLKEIEDNVPRVGLNGRRLTIPTPVQILSQLGNLIDEFTKKNNLIQSNITELEKMETKNDNDNKKLLSNQMAQVKLLQEISQLFTPLLDDTSGIITDIRDILKYDNIPLNQEQKTQIQLQLEQFKKILQTQKSLMKQFYEIFKKENYDFLLPQTKETAVLYIKADLDKLLNNFYDLIKKYNRENVTFRDMLSNTELKTQMLNTVNNLNSLKKHFLEYCAKLLTAFSTKITTQDKFIKAFVELYAELYSFKKTQLETLKKQKVAPVDKLKEEIAVKTLEFDLSCYTSLLNDRRYHLQKTVEYENIREAIKRLLQDSSLPSNSMEELEKYYENRELLMIEKYQFNIYSIEFSLINENNEEIMWNVLSNSTSEFFDNFKEFVFKQINATYILFKRYNDSYSPGERASFLTRYKMRNQPLQKQSILAFASFSKDKEQEQLYLRMINSQIICYDLISLYAKLTTIDLSRTISNFTIRKNITSIKKRKFEEFDRYYRRIKLHMASVFGLIPKPIFWSIDNIDESIDIKIFENRELLDECILEMRDIENELYNLQNYFSDSLDLLLPQLTEMGILKTCYKITDAELEEAQYDGEEVIMTNYEIERKFLATFAGNKDKDETDIFRQQIMNVIKEQMHDNSTPSLNPQQISELLNNWVVSWYDTHQNDSLFYTLATVLNGQLILNQQLSLNPYLDPPINNAQEVDLAFTSKFTPTSLRRCIRENIDAPEIDGYIGMGQNFINELKSQILMPSRNFYERKAKQAFLLNMQKKWENVKFLFADTNFNVNYNAIQTEAGRDRTANRYDLLINPGDIFAIIVNPLLYFGDDITIQIFERVFKIKFIVINTKQKPLNDPDHPIDLIGKSILFRGQLNDKSPEKVVNGYVTNVRDVGGGDYTITVSTFDYQAYSFSWRDSNRYIGLENPFYNVELHNNNYRLPENYPNYWFPIPGNIGAQESIDVDEVPNWNYLFILADEINGKTVYKNVYDFSSRKFLYKFGEMPTFMHYLIFRSLLKSKANLKLDDEADANRDAKNFLMRIPTVEQYNTNLRNRTTGHRDIQFRNRLKQMTQQEKNDLLNPPIRITGGAPTFSNQFVSTNRGNSIYASNKDSRLSYYVVIDLELYPGKDGIPLAQKAVLACQNRYEKIRQAWAKLFGLVYRPNELYVTGFTAPSSLKIRGNERGRDNYRSTRRRKDREYERRPRNRTERG